MNHPYLSLDIGDRYIGLAFSEAGILASQLQTIDRQGKSDDQIFSQMTKIIKDKDIKTLVVGLPVNADGSENNSCQKIRNFIDAFKNSTIYYLLSTIYFPEDFSSIDANYQISQKFRLNQKQPQSHPTAAKIILERFLEESKKPA